MLVHLFTIHLR